MKETKVVFKPFVWVAVLLNIAAVVLALVMQNPDVEYTYEYVNGEIVSHSWLDYFAIGSYIYMGVAILFLIIAIIQIIRFRSQLNVAVNMAVAVILIPVTVVVVLFAKTNITGVNWDYEPKYYEFSNEAHEIVICEKTLGEDAFFEIFQLDDGNEAYLLEEFDTYAGYRNEGDYTIEWFEEGITIQYGVDGTGFEIKQNVKFQK